MGARNTSVLKVLEHCNACVGLAGNNPELAGNGKPELQATAIRSRFSGAPRARTKIYGHENERS